MRKTIISTLVGGIFTALVATAYALTGTPPTPATGPGLVDGLWLNGLAGGTNNIVVTGITVAGSTSATALQLTPGFSMYELDTAPTSNGAVNLPLCVAGTNLAVINNTTNTIFVFPSLLVNTLTATQDTLDGVNSAGGAINIVTTSAAEFYCARNGKWFH